MKKKKKRVWLSISIRNSFSLGITSTLTNFNFSFFTLISFTSLSFPKKNTFFESSKDWGKVTHPSLVPAQDCRQIHRQTKIKNKKNKTRKKKIEKKNNKKKLRYIFLFIYLFIVKGMLYTLMVKMKETIVENVSS